MDLALVEKFLNLQIPLKNWEKDTPNILDPFYNKDKIYKRVVVNAKEEREENDDIQVGSSP